MGRRLSVGCRLEHVMALHHVFSTAAPTCIARQSRTLVPNPQKKYVIYTGTFLELPTAKYPPAVAPSSSFLFVSRDFRGLFTLSSRRDHHMATDDVVREHMRYHCKEASHHPLRAANSGWRNLGAPRRSSKTARPAQASSLASISRQETCLPLRVPRRLK